MSNDRITEIIVVCNRCTDKTAEIAEANGARVRKNYLINSTRKFDDLGDWLYFKLMVKNAGTLMKAAMGDRTGMDKLLDEMFYDYNDRS